MSMTLADILAPMPPERFFAEYYDQQPLHLPGAAEKFADVLDWAGINRLLGMTLKESLGFHHLLGLVLLQLIAFMNEKADVGF
ncbi:MAG: hypothetical protein ING08_03680 [Roseomonas sp.]|nr:hypothetical protein [Roseomonas sp.]